jgi:Fur family ferric uptake transcriptional regulator
MNIREAEMVERNCGIEEYVQCFYAFLDERKLKRSAERNAILRAVFDFDKHFTIEMLHRKLKSQKCFVSKSTLYAAIGLLMDAGLVFKHHLPSQITPQYEKFYGPDAHNHIYVEGSEKMIDFSDQRIEEIKKEIAEKYNVEVINHAFILYCKKRK